MSAYIHLNKTSTNSFMFIHTLSLFNFKGAAIAKKKMMKKFGWYKHSEDGGGTSALTVSYYVYFT